MNFKQIKNFQFTATPSIKEGTAIVSTKEGANWKRLAFAVTDGQSTQFIELFGGQYETIKTFAKSENGAKMEPLVIRWEDRLKPEIMEQVAPFKRFKLALGEKEEVFITEYDFINAIEKAYVEGALTGALYISGQVKRDTYKDKTNLKFNPQFIGKAKAEKLELGGLMTFVVDKYAIDKEAGRDKHQLVIDGWIQDYDVELKKQAFHKQTFIYDYSDILNATTQAEQELVKRRVAYMMQKLTVKDGYHAVQFNVNFFKGTQDTELELTDEQKELIAFGLLTEQQAKRDNGVKGSFINEVRLVRPNTSGAYGTIVVKTSLTDDDIFPSAKIETVSMEDLMPATPTLEDNLFGASTIDLSDIELPF